MKSESCRYFGILVDPFGGILGNSLETSLLFLLGLRSVPVRDQFVDYSKLKSIPDLLVQKLEQLRGRILVQCMGELSDGRRDL